jgi:hypothetical protein
MSGFARRLQDISGQKKEREHPPEEIGHIEIADSRIVCEDAASCKRYHAYRLPLLELGPERKSYHG